MTDALVVTEAGGTITIAGEVVDRIVRRAAEEVDGVKVRRRGLDVRDGRVTVPLTVRYGAVLAEVGEQVQNRIADSLRSSCGVDPSAVDVSIEELT
ncbi:MAG TPA: hypothetical protein VGQ15_09345 [Gaiellaceae bacterium]|nr:hypothetical protein [Gaiellaceae bacterium]